jgi:hypothetical protein
MDVSIAIDPWLVIVLLASFIALRVWHPITEYAGRRKKKIRP